MGRTGVTELSEETGGVGPSELGSSDAADRDEPGTTEADGRADVGRMEADRDEPGTSDDGKTDGAAEDGGTTPLEVATDREEEPTTG